MFEPFLKILPLNNNNKMMTNHIHNVLFLKSMQKSIVENIMNYIIRLNENFCTNKNEQVLLYICEKHSVGKKIVNILKLEFDLLAKQKKFIIVIFIEYAAKNFENNIMHTTLNIDIHNQKTGAKFQI